MKLWWIVVAVVVAVVLAVVVLSPVCASTDWGAVCERRLVVVPGFTIGIPPGTVHTDAVALRDVEISIRTEGDIWQIVSAWLVQQKPLELAEVIKLAAKSSQAGMFVLAVSKELADFAEAIAARYGWSGPDRALSVGGYYCLIFFGQRRA